MPRFACSREAYLCQRGKFGPILDEWYGHYIVNIVLNFILAPIAILGNGLVFSAYYYSPSLRKPVHTIMMSLAATDFLCGAAAQPLYIWEKILMTGGCSGTVCIVVKIERFFTIFLVAATLLNLSVTTLDRYIAVCHCYKYPELVTNSRVKTLLGIVWAVWFILAVGANVFGKVELITASMLSVNIIVIVVLYVMVYREIRRIERADLSVAAGAQNNQEEERKAAERKSAKTVGFILGSLFLSFVPMMILGILVVAGLRFTREVLLIYANTAAFANSAFNVFIYYWRNEEMRKAMLKAIRKITHRAGNQIDVQ